MNYASHAGINTTKKYLTYISLKNLYKIEVKFVMVLFDEFQQFMSIDIELYKLWGKYLKLFRVSSKSNCVKKN